MNVLIIGSGGREHALAWKCIQSSQVDTVFVAPGNSGSDSEPGVQNVALDISNFDALTDFAKDNGVSLTIIGPEAPLVDGIVDAFQAQGLSCFGPSKGAAQLEGSKALPRIFSPATTYPLRLIKILLKWSLLLPMSENRVRLSSSRRTV